MKLEKGYETYTGRKLSQEEADRYNRCHEERKQIKHINPERAGQLTDICYAILNLGGLK